ncbi:MAG: hypothetical protein AAF184_22550 [Pseudomonadota bacterium]
MRHAPGTKGDIMIKTLAIAVILGLGVLHAPASLAAEEPTTRTVGELASALATEVTGDEIARLRMGLEARGLGESDAQATATQAVTRLYVCFLNAAIARDVENGAPPGALLTLLWQSYESDAPASETLHVLEEGDIFRASERAEPCMLNVAQEFGVLDILEHD